MDQQTMGRYDFSHPRLFIDADLHAGATYALAREQSNYLRNVLRLGEGAGVLVFNGRQGEWLAHLSADGRKSASLNCERQIRIQPAAQVLDYVFAPLKHARLDYMVQKATEMGAGRLIPVMTRRTQVTRVNLDRMRANTIEAAEQCGIMTIPEILPPQPLQALLEGWPAGQPLIFCDEDEPGGDPLSRLQQIAGSKTAPAPLAVLIGPEGGFAPEERAMLSAMPQSIIISLGPRILRADTAAVAALALVQAAAGDW
jgi:16S rRNA (uracil1498-N3)-methyltransferase